VMWREDFAKIFSPHMMMHSGDCRIQFFHAGF
jgi:hypothetical protein